MTDSTPIRGPPGRAGTTREVGPPARLGRRNARGTADPNRPTVARGEEQAR